MTKDRIRNGAVAMFAQRGYDETTLDEIAEAAGVAKGTLYYHFKNKEALYGYVLAQGLQDLTEAIARALDGLTPVDQVAALNDALFSYLATERDFCRVLLASSSHHLTHGAEAWSHLGEFFAFLEKTLGELQRQGAIAADLDLATAASATFGMVGMVVLRKHFRGEAADTEPTRATVMRMEARALG